MRRIASFWIEPTDTNGNGRKFEECCIKHFKRHFFIEESPPFSFTHCGNDLECRPDIVLTDRFGDVAVVECKWNSGRLTENQRWYYPMLQDAGVPVFLMRGYGDNPSHPKRLLLGPLGQNLDSKWEIGWFDRFTSVSSMCEHAREILSMPHSF